MIEYVQEISPPLRRARETTGAQTTVVGVGVFDTPTST
eukprot:SAG31_NODE_4583_length_3118_cov_2.039086_4_plen_38_part_00